MPRGAARAQRATRQLFWLLFVSAAAALTPQEQELFNRRLDQLYGSKLVRKAATGQAVVFTGPDSGPTELETEHYGRLHAKHPVRHCCAAEECAAANARVAFVASLRSADYLMGLRELHCSLARTNPGVPLVVLSVEGDLDNATRAEVESLARLRLVENIDVPNWSRYHLNWVKLRVWEWEEYDALILLDVDAVVRGSLAHLFSLPTNFAWAAQNGHTGFAYNRGGVIMLRPCRATFDAMLHVITHIEYYQYKHRYAEQDFLDWFFRYTRYELPTRYNLNFKFLDDDGLGPGGLQPAVIHFADPEDKLALFHAAPGSKAWRYLCHQPSLQQGAQA